MIRLCDKMICTVERKELSREILYDFFGERPNDVLMVVNGDQTQIDLPGKAKSGLLQAEHILQNIEQVKFINFTFNDVVRHPVVAKIVRAYEEEGH